MLQALKTFAASNALAFRAAHLDGAGEYFRKVMCLWAEAEAGGVSLALFASSEDNTASNLRG